MILKEIGGYFGREPVLDQIRSLPDHVFLTKSGRASLKRILRVLNPSRAYLPYYTCDALLEPFSECNIKYSFFEIDKELEIARFPDIQKDELLIYINYFGLKSKYVKRLGDKLNHQLVVDNTQAFYYDVAENNPFFTFNSARKFFGVPDGSLLFVPAKFRSEFDQLRLSSNTNYRLDHLQLRSEGYTSKGYEFFCENERLAGQGCEDMSEYTKDTISRIDLQASKERRTSNFLFLHHHLNSSNVLLTGDSSLESDAVPFAYPLLHQKKLAHKFFWKRRIFIPILWKECLDRVSSGYEWEKRLTQELLPLPIDQRYTIEDMEQILYAIQEIEA